MPEEAQFMADLQHQVAGTAKDCKFYGDLCKSQGFNVNEPITDDTLDQIPYVSWQHFKQSNQEFHKLLRVPIEKMSYWTLSSSSTGDPSLVGRGQADVEVFRSNYRKLFEEYIHMDQMKRLVLLAPSVKFLNRTPFKAMGIRGFLFYRDITTIWNNIPTDFMLDFKIGKLVRYYLSHLKFKAFIEINGKRLEKSLDKCEKEQLPALVANSVPLMWTNLMDLQKKRGKTYSMAQGFKVQTGGGGWSGTKGTVKLEQSIDKAEFFEKIGALFNIPITNFADAFGATEIPVSCGGHWSEKYQDIVHHLDMNQGRIILRDIESGERITNTGEEGMLEVISPYGVSTYAGVAVLMDDIVEILDHHRCEECGREGMVFRIVRKYTSETGKGCTSFTIYRPLKQ